MAEKAIIGKMSLYETMTMIVPGTMIVFCVWLAAPELWSKNLCSLDIPNNLNFLFDTAIVLALFALSYVAGVLNYRLVDCFWGKIGMRNNICMLKGSLQDRVDSEYYENIKDLVKETPIHTMKYPQIEDIYYEAYTYALKQNTKSNVPHLENQVAMLKGLIVPLSWLILALCPERWEHFKWWVVIAVVIVLIALAITRQKKIINIVLEDYEYEKRIELKK